MKTENFTEMVLEICRVFNVKHVDFKTEGDKSTGADLLFWSGLVVRFRLIDKTHSLQVQYGHMASQPITPLIEAEKRLLKDICDNAANMIGMNYS